MPFQVHVENVDNRSIPIHCADSWRICAFGEYDGTGWYCNRLLGGFDKSDHGMLKHIVGSHALRESNHKAVVVI